MSFWSGNQYWRCLTKNIGEELVGYRIARTSAFLFLFPPLVFSLSLSLHLPIPTEPCQTFLFLYFLRYTFLLALHTLQVPPPSRPSPLTISSSDRLFFFSSRPIQPNPNLTDPLLPRTLLLLPRTLDNLKAQELPREDLAKFFFFFSKRQEQIQQRPPEKSFGCLDR